MTKENVFKRSIQMKFLLLRLFIAFVILLVSAAAVIFVQRIADNSEVLTNTYVPLLREIQELHGSILSESLDGVTVLSTVRNDTEGTRSVHIASLNFTESRSILEHLRSQTVDDPVMGSLLDEVYSTLLQFDTTFAQVARAREVAESFQGEGNEEEASSYAESLRLLDELDDNRQDILAALNALEEYTVEKINIETTNTREQTKTNQLLITLISTLAMLLTLFVGLLFSNRTIVKPLHELTKTAEEMAEGNLDKRVKIQSQDEIGKLAHTFNTMAEKLKSSYGDLEKKHSRLNEFLSSLKLRMRIWRSHR
jgi:HAMP domain-containing protein